MTTTPEPGERRVRFGHCPNPNCKRATRLPHVKDSDGDESQTVRCLHCSLPIDLTTFRANSFLDYPSNRPEDCP